MYCITKNSISLKASPKNRLFPFSKTTLKPSFHRFESTLKRPKSPLEPLQPLQTVPHPPKYHSPMSNPQKLLADYFDTTNFQFAGDVKNQVASLKRWMELVYLRDRPLVAVDIEAFERNSNLVTEVGFAIYDPKEQGATLLPSIRTVHLIIKEHANKKNGRCVPDNAHRCLLGKSHIVDLRQCSAFISEVFRHYFEEDQGVLVGHGIKGDIKWLKTLVGNVPETCPIVDTTLIHKLSRKGNGSLEGILRQVEIPCGRLHNAANDAFYTLQAVMAWCDPYYRRKYNLDVYDSTITLVSKNIRRRMQFDDAAVLVHEEDGIHLYERLWGCVPEEGESDVEM